MERVPSLAMLAELFKLHSYLFKFHNLFLKAYYQLEN